ncbi:MAG: DMT family transporter [Clostridiales bacterium]|nr:DMT family transporter [Clostridiales bacterium]
MNSIPQKYKGILCIIFSAFGFACMSVFVRLAGDIPSFQKSFFRNLIAALIALITILRSGEKLSYPREILPLLTARSVFGTIGILCNFYAVDHLALADANMLSKLSPFFATFFSFFLLKENLKPYQILSLVIAFIGALFVIKPTGSAMNLIPALSGLCGGIAAGLAYTLVRMLGLRGVKGPKIVFFFSLFSCLSVSPVLIFDYHPMSGFQLAMLLGAGAAASIGQFGVTAAYFYAPAKEISVYDYSQILFSALLGFFFFGQIPDVWSVIGYVIIITTAVVVFMLHKKTG